MQIIKESQLIDDNWHFCPDESPVPDDANITVSVTRLLAESNELMQRKGRLGVRIDPADSVEQMANYLPKLALVELHFSEMADGRLFSHAWLLRNRYGYQGELRATGHFLPDQVFYLSRVGVTAFHPDNSARLADMLASLKDFSVKYQPSTH